MAHLVMSSGGSERPAAGSGYGTTKGGGDRREHVPLAVPQLKIVRDTGAPWLDLPLSESAGPRS